MGQLDRSDTTASQKTEA
uniref:SFRICE_038156 n=1 Tax=Spodoptera frugiperda TaxID=7108 RepID=A0A2H1X2V2_SPOFR